MISKKVYLLLVFLIISQQACEPKSENKPKSENRIAVIIDSDMAESFDDGIAFMMLMGTDGVEVKGVTTETTNVWAQEALAYGIRLGELCGGEDISYVAGSQYPLRSGRLDTINQEIEASPGKDSDWRGAVSYQEVTDWKMFYVGKYGRQPEIHPSETDAAEFICLQVMSWPGEVTILAIGECTNIAKALSAHPEIASMTKEIIYMGGAVFCPGNTTTYAEMNFLYDPEAAAICLRAPFPRQTIVSLDVCNEVTMDRDRFMSVYNAVKSEDIKALLRCNYPYPEFEKDPYSKQMVWDLISAAIAVDPSIVTEYDDVRLDVDDRPGSPTYGKSFVTSDTSRRIVRVPRQINQERFWEITVSGMSKH